MIAKTGWGILSQSFLLFALVFMVKEEQNGKLKKSSLN
jgi:hypothetical protein